MRKAEFFLAVLLLAGCNKSPFDRTRDASGGGALNKFGVAPGLVVFNDELVTGGGAFEYPGGANQVLVFNDRSNPISERSIRYSWNGQAPGGEPTNPPTFAGFDLAVSLSATDYPSTPARNLTAAGYTKVTFFARGALSSNTDLKIEVASGSPQPCLLLSTSGTDNPGALPCSLGQLTGNWGSYSIALPPGSLSALKDFFKATFIFTPPFVGSTAPGQGGVAYFDQIIYTP